MAYVDSINAFASYGSQTRALEVEKLIDIGMKCGIESIPDFFREMIGVVYGSDPSNKFLESMTKMLESATSIKGENRNDKIV